MAKGMRGGEDPAPEETTQTTEIVEEEAPMDDHTYPTDEEKEFFSGQCVGGPMDKQHGESRFPKGFVLIDAPNSRAWVYDYNDETGEFVAREQDIHDRQRAYHAAEGSNYDVRAYEGKSRT